MITTAPNSRKAKDLFVTEDSLPGRERTHRSDRPRALRQTLGALGGLLLSRDAPMMAQFHGAKIVGLLQKLGAMPAEFEMSVVDDAQFLTFLGTQLADIAGGADEVSSIAAGLQELIASLNWYKAGDAGPFASLNFGSAHRHALLVGPDGLEHRTDIKIGITALAPYTRFPDHHQLHSTVYVPLSAAEFRFGDDDWVRCGKGSILFGGVGQLCAMRCTAKPLIMLWCRAERYTLSA